jgi:hypothetical protein
MAPLLLLFCLIAWKSETPGSSDVSAPVVAMYIGSPRIFPNSFLTPRHGRFVQSKNPSSSPVKTDTPTLQQQQLQVGAPYTAPSLPASFYRYASQRDATSMVSTSSLPHATELFAATDMTIPCCNPCKEPCCNPCKYTFSFLLTQGMHGVFGHATGVHLLSALAHSRSRSCCVWFNHS